LPPDYFELTADVKGFKQLGGTSTTIITGDQAVGLVRPPLNTAGGRFS
jgi:hypothetical protein